MNSKLTVLTATSPRRPNRLRLAAGLLALCAALPAQSFQYDHGSPTATEVGTALVRVQGGYVIAGSRGITDLLGLGVNANGEEVVDGSYAPSLSGRILTPHCLRQTADGGFIVSGEVLNNSPDAQVFLAKFDANGSWQTPNRFTTYRGHATSMTRGTRVVEMSGGGFAVMSNLAPNTQSQGVLFATTPTGGLLWWRSYSQGNRPVRFHDMRQEADGTFTIVGTVQTASSLTHPTLILRTTPAGLPIWAKLYGNPGENIDKSSITGTKDGGLVVWGHHASGSLLSGSFLLKIDACGAPLWRTQFPSILGTRPTVAETANGDLLCNGRVVYTAADHDGLVLRTTATGVIKHARTYGGAQFDEIYQVVPTDDGGFAAVGSTQLVATDRNVYLVKGDAAGHTGCYERTPAITQTSLATAVVDEVIAETLGGSEDGVDVADPVSGSSQTELCFEPHCVKAPGNAALWLPFEEMSGSEAFNVLSLAGAPNGDHQGGGLFPGKVGRARSLDGFDWVEVPDHDLIDVTDGDFTIDAWIQVPANISGTKPIVDKRATIGAQTRGYSFYLHKDSGGTYLGVQLADGTPTDYRTPALVLAADQWHFVAVSVRRNAASPSYLVVNDTSYPFTAGNPGSLSTTMPLRVGRNTLGQAGIGFVGQIDELEIFRRALNRNELRALWRAGGEGKCKEWCWLPSQTQICQYENSVTVFGSVCNATDATQSYTCWFQGLPDGPGCSVQGPTVFTSQPTLVANVLPGTCKVFIVTIVRPVGMNAANQVGCYRMLVESTSGEAYTRYSAITDRRDICPGSANGSDHTALRIRTPTQLGPIRLSNTTAAPIALAYRFVAKTDDRLPDDSVLSINGLAPGVPSRGSAVIQPGGYVDLNVSVEFVAHDPLGTYELQLEADLDNDGWQDFIHGRVLTCYVGNGTVYTGIAAPTTVGTPTLSTSGPARIGSTFSVIANGLGPNGVAFLGLSASLASQPFPLAPIGGQPTSFLYLDPATLLTFPLTGDSNGHATFALSVPNNSALSGAVLHFQVFDFDPALPYALPLGNSNAMSVTIE